MNFIAYNIIIMPIKCVEITNDYLFIYLFKIQSGSPMVTLQIYNISINIQLKYIHHKRQKEKKV